MSAPPQTKGAPITGKADLVRYFEEGCKPVQDWRIGTEHEKFGFCWESLRPLPYHGERSVRALLEGLAELGWQPVFENDNPISLQKGACNITLEPGGQLELSGAPLETIHQTCARCTATWTRSSRSPSRWASA